jgi:hypothetical protein
MVTFITAIGRMTISIPVVLTSIAPPATGNGTVVRDTSSATIANGNSRVLDSGGVRHNDERPVILGNTFAMKRWIAITLLLLVPALASAEPITTGNYLRYSYRDHYRAYGINSLTDGTLPPDEYYYDPCYQWVNTTRGLKRKFVCRP